jgi:hypothetical protein
LLLKLCNCRCRFNGRQETVERRIRGRGKRHVRT